MPVVSMRTSVASASFVSCTEVNSESVPRRRSIARRLPIVSYAWTWGTFKVAELPSTISIVSASGSSRT